MIDKFIKWYRLTHWEYCDWWLDHDEGRFSHPETQLMYSAYCAGYNKRRKETK